MKVVSPVISMDVDIEEVHIRDQLLVLSGFSGVNEIETRITHEEAFRLLQLCLRPKIIWFCVKGLWPLGKR